MNIRCFLTSFIGQEDKPSDGCDVLKAAAEAFPSFRSRLFALFSPRNNLINYRPLLVRGPRQINPCSLNAVMPHQIRQQRNIVKSGQKILCEPMPERVRVDGIRVDPVTPGQHL